jgi:N-acetylmuramoyl-L-alanine amidase
MSKPLVILDPGHGGYDSGASYNGLKEKDLNLLLALKTAERLEGIKVLLTRERDIYVSLADRVALSRRAEPHLFLSLHANAGGGHGFESFINSGLGPADPAVAMQRAIHSSVITTLARWERRDRGMKKASFYVLRYNPGPAVLIESLFIDNVSEAAIWREPLFADTLAAALATGIYSALNLPGLLPRKAADLPPVAATEPAANRPGGQTLYTVQLGAFALLENARQRLSEAQQAGFHDAYIYHKQL